MFSILLRYTGCINQLYHQLLPFLTNSKINKNLAFHVFCVKKKENWMKNKSSNKSDCVSFSIHFFLSLFTWTHLSWIELIFSITFWGLFYILQAILFSFLHHTARHKKASERGAIKTLMRKSGGIKNINKTARVSIKLCACKFYCWHLCW